MEDGGSDNWNYETCVNHLRLAPVISSSMNEVKPFSTLDSVCCVVDSQAAAWTRLTTCVKTSRRRSIWQCRTHWIHWNVTANKLRNSLTRSCQLTGCCFITRVTGVAARLSGQVDRLLTPCEGPESCRIGRIHFLAEWRLNQALSVHYLILGFFWVSFMKLTVSWC